MHMHCVFFNLVGAKSRRVPLLVPTSSLYLLQWPLLYKHLAEIQFPQANKHNRDDTPPGKKSIISEITIYVVNYSSTIKYIRDNLELYDRAKEKERYTIYMMGYWCHGEKKLSNYSDLWNSHFSTLAPKTFSGKSESLGNLFSLLFLLKTYREGIIFCVHLYTCDNTSESLISGLLLGILLEKSDKKKNLNTTTFAS